MSDPAQHNNCDDKECKECGHSKDSPYGKYGDPSKELEGLTLVKELAHFKPVVEKQLTELIYNGLWFSPLRNSIKAFIKDTQQYVNGTVRVRLFKGHAVVEGRKSPNSLYDEKLATYTKDDEFNHNSAVGFIELWGLPTKVNAIVNGKKVGKA